MRLNCGKRWQTSGWSRPISLRTPSSVEATDVWRTCSTPLSHLDAPHQRFALGLWIKDRGVRLDRFRALYRAFADIDPAWKTLERPFSRPLYDPSTMLGLVTVGAQGEPAAPAYRRFWDRALAGIEVPSAGTRELKDVFEDGVVDGAWLAEHVLQGLSPERQARLGCFAFGQRVFGSATAEELDDALVAIRACADSPRS